MPGLYIIDIAGHIEITMMYKVLKVFSMATRELSYFVEPDHVPFDGGSALVDLKTRQEKLWSIFVVFRLSKT